MSGFNHNNWIVSLCLSEVLGIRDLSATTLYGCVRPESAFMSDMKIQRLNGHNNKLIMALYHLLKVNFITKGAENISVSVCPSLQMPPCPDTNVRNPADNLSFHGYTAHIILSVTTLHTSHILPTSLLHLRGFSLYHTALELPLGLWSSFLVFLTQYLISSVERLRESHWSINENRWSSGRLMGRNLALTVLCSMSYSKESKTSWRISLFKKKNKGDGKMTQLVKYLWGRWPSWSSAYGRRG